MGAGDCERVGKKGPLNAGRSWACGSWGLENKRRGELERGLWG